MYEPRRPSWSLQKTLKRRRGDRKSSSFRFGVSRTDCIFHRRDAASGGRCEATIGSSADCFSVLFLPFSANAGSVPHSAGGKGWAARNFLYLVREFDDETQRYVAQPVPFPSATGFR